MIPMCGTCLGVIDVVVGEWRTTELGAGAAVSCFSCGRRATVLVDPTRVPEAELSVEVDRTTPTAVIRLRGAMTEPGLEIVGVELAVHARGAAAAVVSLRDVVLVRPITLRVLLRELRRMAGSSARLGLVIQRARLSALGADLAEHDGWTVGEDEALVIAALDLHARPAG